jgi:hypothetical protein
VFLFSHGLNPRDSTIFLFVSIRQGFPFSILSKVLIDKPALLDSSDLLIISISLATLSALFVEILDTSL